MIDEEVDDLDFILNYANYALGILSIGENYAKVFVAVKQMLELNTKQTKELLETPFPIILKRGVKRTLVRDSIQLEKIGVDVAIIFIDDNGEMNWSR
jgi:hypothetical protein